MFPEVHIIEASAGSGKTRHLAKKYISLVLNPSFDIHFSSLLAITFTNKAAFEMKERVLEFLKKIALNSFKDEREKKDLISGLGDEKLVRERALRVLDEIVRNYNFFQIQTIDSFINTILYGCAYKLGLSVNFKTEKYYRSYLSYSLDRLIEKANLDKRIREIFREFIRQYLLIENKTGWFPKQNILDTVLNLFSIYNRLIGKFVPNEIEIKFLFTKKKEVLQKLRKLRQTIPPHTHKRFVEVLDSFLKTHRDNFNINEISSYFKHSDFPLHKGEVLPEEISHLWREIKSDLEEICKIEAFSFFNSYIEIFNRVLLEAEDYIKKDNLIFLESLNKNAYFLFKEASLGLPELYYRLSLRLKHFLIDEFQDTSRLQWENIFVMIEDGLARGGSLFYVGDKKQAIYRFRGGEVSLFEDVKRQFKNFTVKEELLKENYRSRKEIIKFNNSVFSKGNLQRFILEKHQNKDGIKLEEKDIVRILEVFKDAEQTSSKEGGYVKIDIFTYNDRDERDEILKGKLISLIRELKERRFLLSDIAILARKNTEVELLTNWLLENSIAVESEKTLNIRENPYIKEVISFLKFLSHPVDNLSFTSFILGEIFCKKANIEKSVLHDFIFETELKEETKFLYTEFRKRYDYLWRNLIEEFFKSVGFIPLYELLVTFFEKFSVFDNFCQCQGFFMKLLELVKENEEDYPDIFSFLEFFERIPSEELYVNVGRTDAVRIMTIHKAKGLGFPVVIIPFAEMILEHPRQSVSRVGDDLRLVYLRKIYNDYSAYLSQLCKEEYLASFIDELNTLYVAFTRAEDELYIFFTNNANRKKNETLLIPDNRLEYGKKIVYSEKKDSLSSPIAIPASKYEDWIYILKEEFIDKSLLKERRKIVYGEIVHKVLSYIGNLYLKDKNSILEEAMEKTRASFPFFDNYASVKRRLSLFLDDKKFKEIFEVKDGEVFQELEMVDKSGDTHRVDRLIIKGKEVLVVDYKTSKEKEQDDVEQVRKYISILQDIYPGKVVKGILIYLEDLSYKRV